MVKIKKPAEFNNFPTQITDDPRWRNSIWRFRAVMKRVVDGDTAYLLIDEGFRSYSFHSFRLDGYDAPELNRGTTEEKLRGRNAKAFLENELPLDTPVGITTQEGESFNRFIATLYYVRNGEVVNIKDVMEENGHVV